MTAGPTPVPPQVLAKMAEPVLYHRAPAGVELYARVLERLPRVFRTDNTVLAFAASGSGAMELRRRQPRPPGHEGARLRRRQVRRALDRAVRGLRRRPRQVRAGLGHAPRPAGDRPPARREPGHRGRLRDPVGDVDRHRARHRGDRRSGQGAGRGARVDAVSGLAAANWRRMTWGIDVVVAGSQKSLMSRPASRSRRSPSARWRCAAEARRSLLLRLGSRRPRPAQGPANSPFTPAVTLFAALDVALGLILDEGMENVFARHALLAQRPGPASRRSASTGSGPGRAGERRHRARLPDTIEGAASRR